MAFEAYLQALDGISKFMAVCGNGNVHAWLIAGESAAPYFGHFSNLTLRLGAFQMQSCTFPQIQTTQNQAAAMASTCHASGFAAIVYEPIAYFDDLKACSSIARPLGIYPSQGAAILACKSFINSISDGLKEWAAYSVTHAG